MSTGDKQQYYVGVFFNMASLIVQIIALCFKPDMFLIGIMILTVALMVFLFYQFNKYKILNEEYVEKCKKYDELEDLYKNLKNQYDEWNNESHERYEQYVKARDSYEFVKFLFFGSKYNRFNFFPKLKLYMDYLQKKNQVEIDTLGFEYI
ncbi:MAG: hypothetical protein NC094_13870 [Bacteroidales bacterium]|nr:hypothetical protein [Lachnoclostridium sp.]MCM1384213.1 hypothetical protein [Lachnoclostridium sp.]MCM1466489.1 hypothetical protein [Bacteroidales bacterium]